MSGTLKLIVIGVVLLVLLVVVAEYGRRKHPERFERFMDKAGELIVLEFIPGPLKALGAILLCMWGVGSIIGYYTRDVKLSLEPKVRNTAPAPDSGVKVDQKAVEDAAKAAALSVAASGQRPNPSTDNPPGGSPGSDFQAGNQGVLPPLPTPFGPQNPPRPQPTEKPPTPIPATLDKSREESEKQRRRKEAAEIADRLDWENKRTTPSIPAVTPVAVSTAAPPVRTGEERRTGTIAPAATVAPIANTNPVPAPYGQLGNDPEPYVRVQKVRGDMFLARLTGRKDGFLSFRRINGDEFKMPEKSVAHVNGIPVSKLPTFGR